VNAEILVVDDDPRLRELVRYTLVRAGFSVREATNGAEALRAVEQREPDLLVLDVLMPEVDGVSVCRELRRERNVPIIFLSTRGEVVDRVIGLDLGGDDYLAKPFAPSELVSRVHAVLRRTQRAAHPEIYESLGLTIDLARFTVRAGDARLQFTRTELRILTALVAARGAVQSREQLVRAAYDGPHHVSDRTVDSHIRGVRAVLRTAGVDHVETVTGVGWRWGRE
jgi:two-component system OmpR family response regulator